MRRDSILLLPVLLLLEHVDRLDTADLTRFATDCVTPNSENGLCIEIQNCAKLFREVELNNVASYEFIRASRCGPANEDPSRPKVCCGPDTNFVNKEAPTEAAPAAALPLADEYAPTLVLPSTTFTTTSTPPPPSSHSILPRKCGKQKIFLENKIFGGKEANVGEFPWLGRLVHYNKFNRTGLGCSGFLIHRRFILTAAHCLVGKGIEHLGQLNGVIFGIHNDTKARICTEDMCTDPPLNVETLTPIIHAEYDSHTHMHDIALIPLRQKVNFTDFIKAICLGRTSTSSGMFVISGWGRTETDASSRTKLKVELPRYNTTVCAAKYKTLGLTLSNNQICAGGERGHDSCSGDSGGPLMAMGNDDFWYAEGIVSYGNSCGREDWPGVYTYIPNYYDWIVDNIRDILRRIRK